MQIPKTVYYTKNAQKEYRALLSEAREGVPLAKDSFYEIDRILSEGVNRRQRLYHIMQSKTLSATKPTIYRHLKRGYLLVSPIDFPRVVKFKPRKQQLTEYVSKAAKIGRTYDDFLIHTSVYDIPSWVEKYRHRAHRRQVILTFDFTFCNFMFVRLLENKTALEVVQR